MRINSKKDLEKMSFIDFKVLDTSIEKMSRSIMFFFSGALRSIAGKRMELGKGYLKVIRYDSINITSYNAKEKVEAVLSENNFEHLDELCEIDTNKNELVLKGFAKNGNWIEFTVMGGEVKGEFKEKQ